MTAIETTRTRQKSRGNEPLFVRSRSIVAVPRAYQAVMLVVFGLFTACAIGLLSARAVSKFHGTSGTMSGLPDNWLAIVAHRTLYDSVEISDISALTRLQGSERLLRDIRAARLPPPTWVTLPKAHGMEVWVAVQTGFPVRCFRGQVYAKTKGSPTPPPSVAVPLRVPTGLTLVDGIRTQGKTGELIDGFMPLGIVWKGLVLNTLVYAIAAWFAWSLMLVGIGRWRLLRGLCYHCGYPLADASKTCSECGLSGSAAVESQRDSRA